MTPLVLQLVLQRPLPLVYIGLRLRYKCRHRLVYVGLRVLTDERTLYTQGVKSSNPLS